jgi:hypothetical protein
MRRVVSALLAVAFAIAVIAPVAPASASPAHAAIAPHAGTSWLEQVLAEIWIEITGIATPPVRDTGVDGKPAGTDLGPDMDPNG